MSEEQAFLRAILERPDDDAPKLIYADWLEERGDPRGEFLRGVVNFRSERVVTPEQRRRHDELSAEIVAVRRQQRQGPGNEINARELLRREQGPEDQLAGLARQIRRPVSGTGGGVRPPLARGRQ